MSLSYVTFLFAVAIILSRFCLCQVLPYFIMSETKGPHHIHSLRSSCFIKKSAFNDAGNFVMVVKFTFQSVFSNSCRNPRDFSARGSEESLELYSLLWSDCMANINTKCFTSLKLFCHSGLQTLFSGGREVTTGNATAVRRLSGVLFVL